MSPCSIFEQAIQSRGSVFDENQASKWVNFRQSSTSYRYEDDAIDLSGRPAPGFAKVTVTDESTNIKTATSYAQIWPFAGRAVRVVKTASDGTVLSDVANSWKAKVLANESGKSSQFVYLAASNETRRDLDKSNFGSFAVKGAAGGDVQYDDWGNLLKMTKSSTGSLVNANDSSSEDITNEYEPVDLTNWLLAKLKRSTIVRTGGDALAITQATSFTYTADNRGRIKTKTIEPDDASAKFKVLTTFTYNDFGLMSSAEEAWRDTYSSTDLKRTTTYEYDTNGRFRTRTTDPLGQVVSAGFDGATGARTSQTDPNGLTVSWSVDGLGRPTKELRPDGNETRSDFKQCAGDCPSDATQLEVRQQYHGTKQIAVPAVVYKDSLGRVLRSTGWTFDGTKVNVDTKYKAATRVIEQYQPYKAADGSAPASKLEWRKTFDVLDRLTSHEWQTSATGMASDTTAYSGLTTVVKRAGDRSYTYYRNAAGQLEKSTDPNGNSTLLVYGGLGNLVKTTDPDGNVTAVTYDIRGRRIKLSDPDLGDINYRLDALGRVRQQDNPVLRGIQKQTTMDYDLVDRMLARVEDKLESHWEFGTVAPAIGKLVKAYTVTGTQHDYERNLSYDDQGRLTDTTQTLYGAVFKSHTDYDGWSRELRQTLTRGSDAAKVFDLRYNDKGYLVRLERSGLVLWEAKKQDEANRLLEVALGNGLSVTQSFNAYSTWLERIAVKLGTDDLRVQDDYVLKSDGTLTQLTRAWDNKLEIEDYVYDSLNRLSSSKAAGQAEQDYTYSKSGNLKSKTGVGTGDYVYPSATAGGVTVVRHAVSSIPGYGAFSYDDNGNMLTAPGRTYSWTSFDMPSVITKGTKSASFNYGPEHQRTRQTREDGSMTVYAGAQEVEIAAGGVATVKTYWPLGVGMETDVQGQVSLNWFHKDRQGSVIAITDAGGALTARLNYDPWGNRRQPDASATPVSLLGVVDNKGYTGHEMLDPLELVHMNGRVFDPLVARFVSADPFVQAPEDGQSYNRYSYVLNNPMNLTDPTGYTSEPADKNDATPRIYVTRSASLESAMASLLIQVRAGWQSVRQTVAKLGGQSTVSANSWAANHLPRFSDITDGGYTGLMINGVRSVSTTLSNLGDMAFGDLILGDYEYSSAAIHRMTHEDKDATINSIMIAAGSVAGLRVKGALGNPVAETLSASDFPAVGSKISQKQLRHIGGRNEYRGGGYLDSVESAQKVLNAYHSGSATILGKSQAGFPIVRYEGVTGTNVNLPNFPNQPTNVFMIKGTSAPSVVPMNPNWTPR
ncbi:RHS repeat domain-containing protein [Massilia sp. TS11]|uniref:RHS repeat domain-containing protein n=1 Tax=Massilia sp. TS11 TaxID=2908003 RepID=UPI001EDADF15|nr:RHS repeat-associated core domain-containing protein [Massilia sp. TS11]MCG2583851.1 hypothetical protein [Massilia sp. TS11]